MTDQKDKQTKLSIDPSSTYNIGASDQQSVEPEFLRKYTLGDKDGKPQPEVYTDLPAGPAHSLSLKHLKSTKQSVKQQVYNSTRFTQDSVSSIDRSSDVMFEEVDPKKEHKVEIKKKAFKVDRLLLILAFMRFIVDSSYSIMAPIFPTVLSDKGIDPNVNGYIFSTFSAALLLSAPFVGYYLSRYERMIFLRIGLMCLGISMIGFGCSTYINDTTTFLVVVYVCRFIQGAASSVNDTTILSITGLMYSDNQAAAIALILMFSGIGYTLAPFFGSVLFEKVAEISPYLVFAAIQIAFSLTLSCLMTKDVNQRMIDSVITLTNSIKLNRS